MAHEQAGGDRLDLHLAARLEVHVVRATAERGERPDVLDRHACLSVPVAVELPAVPRRDERSERHERELPAWEPPGVTLPAE